MALFFRLEIWYWTENSITIATVHSPRATTAMLLLRRMEFVQSVTWCEAAAVVTLPATPLLLPYCNNSRESNPKAWKRHTPLSVLQDPRLLGHMTGNKRREKIQLRENALDYLFHLNFWYRYCILVVIYSGLDYIYIYKYNNSREKVCEKAQCVQHIYRRRERCATLSKTQTDITWKQGWS